MSSFLAHKCQQSITLDHPRFSFFLKKCKLMSSKLEWLYRFHSPFHMRRLNVNFVGQNSCVTPIQLLCLLDKLGEAHPFWLDRSAGRFGGDCPGRTRPGQRRSGGLCRGTRLGRWRRRCSAALWRSVWGGMGPEWHGRGAVELRLVSSVLVYLFLAIFIESMMTKESIESTGRIGLCSWDPASTSEGF